MNETGYSQALVAEGARLTSIAAGVDQNRDDLKLVVAGCPGWDLEALLVHCAKVWTFVGGSVSARAPIDRASITRPDEPLSHWLANAFDGLTEALRARTPAEAVWTFDPRNSSIRFWWRRMAHEATMHRWDAETALGIEPAATEPELAVDAIDELFEFFIPVRQPSVYAGNGQTVHLHATDADGEWIITRGANGIDVRHAHEKSDVAARGSAQDLMLFVWGRIDPSRLQTFGDVTLLEDWQRLVKF